MTVKWRTALLVVLVPMMLGLSASPARAQAFLPAKGEGTVSILFQDMFVKDHYTAAVPVDLGPIQSETLLVDVTYGLTDKVAVSIGIPWIASKYTGTFPHPLADFSGPVPVFYGANPLDDGSYHGAFQDFRFNVRYNLTKKGLVLTPFVGSVVPSHDYSYFAHSAPGLDLNELQLGVSAARLLDSLVPGLLVQGTNSYGVREKALDVSPNHSNMSIELGYFATPKLRLLALSTGQLTHGGIDLVPSARVNLPAIQFAHHDQIQRDNFLDLGGGAAYSLTDRVDLFGSLIRTVAKRNGHALDRGVTVGLSWSFSTKRANGRAIASNQENSLTRCLCEKKPM